MNTTGMGAVRVGVNLLNFGPGANPDALRRWAQVIEALGYHSIMISDHVAITPSVKPRYPEPFYDCFTTLAWLAGQTQRVQLGTTVAVLPYRHPVLAARVVANIDQLSGGRFIFGVGVGNAEDEFAVLGQPRNRRGAIADETLAAILALWTGTDPVSVTGRHVSFADVSPIRPFQQLHPPVWVGGQSEAALRRAARFGDGWHPILRSIAATRDSGLPGLREAAAAANRPVPAFCPRIRLDIRPNDLDGERVPGAGSLAQMHDDLRELEKLGAQHVILDWNTGDVPATANHEHGWEMLALLAERVLDLARETVR